MELKTNTEKKKEENNAESDEKKEDVDEKKSNTKLRLITTEEDKIYLRDLEDEVSENFIRLELLFKKFIKSNRNFLNDIGNSFGEKCIEKTKDKILEISDQLIDISNIKDFFGSELDKFICTFMKNISIYIKLIREKNMEVFTTNIIERKEIIIFQYSTLNFYSIWHELPNKEKLLVMENIEFIYNICMEIRWLISKSYKKEKELENIISFDNLMTKLFGKSKEKYYENFNIILNKIIKRIKKGKINLHELVRLGLSKIKL